MRLALAKPCTYQPSLPVSTMSQSLKPMPCYVQVWPMSLEL